MTPCPTCNAPARRPTSVALAAACPFCGAVLLALSSPAFAQDGGMNDAEPERPPVEAIYGVPATDGLNFSPDRPGVGDSTGTVGQGHVMVEAGLAFVPSPVSFGTGGILGRVGIGSIFELRGRVPDVVYTDPQGSGASAVGVGPVGVGAKIATAPGSGLGLSAVPEVTIVPGSGTVGASLGGNITGTAGPVGVWGHTTVGWNQDDGGGWLVGGGVSTATLDGWGLYVNGGVNPLDTTGFAGGGGWLALGARGQLDAGVDVGLGGGTVTPVVLLGGSVGF